MKIKGLVHKAPVNDGPYGVEYEISIGAYSISEIADMIEKEYKGEEVVLIINHVISGEED
jgi:hypothetical protein